MSYYCALDVLPVELLHILFIYFSAHEILLAFSDVSDYINDVLSVYSGYRLDLDSIRKSDFDLIRHRILPEQVIALRLSDDNNTLVQSELFLSYFQIEQFTRLRSLTLIEIEIKSLKSIFSNLHTLAELCSLSFNIETIRHTFPVWNDDYSNESNRLQSFISNIYTRVLPQLNHIRLNNSIDLISITLPHLRQLKLVKFSFDDLKIIFQNSPQLKSLDICVDMDMLNTAFILPSNQLIRLNLEIQNRRIAKDQIEQFLSNLSHLKHLELKANVWEDITDGHFWQILTNSFKTFNFKFNALQINVQKTLDSFRTPFWLEEKSWYVAFQNGCLFSLPYFAPVHMDTLNLSYFLSTAPDHAIIYRHLNKLTVNTIPINNPHHHRCNHIKTLVLEFSVSLKILESVVHLNQVEHLIISSVDKLLIFIPLEHTMFRLSKLTVKNSVTMGMIERIRYQEFKQIRTLQIRLMDKDIDCITEELFLLFSRLEHLVYKSRIYSVAMMIRLMVGFEYLSNASFSADCSFFRKESTFCRNPNSITEYLPRHTCQVFHLTNTQLPLSIHWRIEDQSTNRLTCIYWPSRRGYRWYRLKHNFLRVLNNNLTLIEYLIQFLIYFSIVVMTHTFYHNFDIYFCLIKTMFITILYNFIYRLFHLIKNDNLYIAYIYKLYIWFVFGLTVFFFSFISQIVFDYIVR